MSKLMKKLNSPIACDIVFSLAAIGSVATLVFATGHGMPAVEASDNPLRAGLSVLAVLVTAVVIAATTARADRGNTDEYVDRALNKSARIGIVALIFAAGVWKAGFADNLGSLSGTSVLALAVAAWSIGYLYTRIRGTVE